MTEVLKNFFRTYTQNLPSNIPYVTLSDSFKKSGRQNILIPELYPHSYTHTHTHTPQNFSQSPLCNPSYANISVPFTQKLLWTWK